MPQRAFKLPSHSIIITLCLGLFALFTTARVPAASAATEGITNPILFVTQVPIPDDYTTILSTIGNQRGDLDAVPRGGDLMIRYPDGTLKNLTKAAGYGNKGRQGAKSIAVRDPAMYWDGTKAIFSMVIGAPTAQYQTNQYYWQLYEITGLQKSDTPKITKVPNQPANFNNIAPTYGTDDRIIFTSDRPRSGDRWLYPQRDEYESAPTVTGLWSLDPASGDLFLLEHAPSGAFNPFVDSAGRVVFTRWDHLQRDQQADSDHDANAPFTGSSCNTYCTFNFADESQNSARLQTRDEIFPEPRTDRTDLLKGTNLEGYSFNDFAPWTINEDGTAEETLDHVGRHELLGYFDKSLTDDPNLEEYYGQYPRTNKHPIENFLQIEEDPRQPGRYFGIDAPEFFTHGAGQVISINGAPNLNADQMTITYWTHRDTASFTNHPGPDNSGHYRDVLPLSSGPLIASHTAFTDKDSNAGTRANPKSHYDFRLQILRKAPNGFFVAKTMLTAGIKKNISYWDPDVLVSYNGYLWEIQPVEVRARPRPQRLTPSVPAPEVNMFAQAGVNIPLLQDFMRQNNLALFVSRNVTQRDDADHQQPFNLQVEGTATRTIGKPGKIYTVAFLQFFQGDLIRGMGGVTHPYAGRRVIAQYLHDSAALAADPPNASAPQSSVTIASDGSVAAFVPARSALTWQTTDANGVGVVRERMWITFQPGEIRVCTSCHGVNDKDQAGNSPAANPPQALYDLLSYWKSHN